MDISLARLAMNVFLYAICFAFTAWLIWRFQRRAARDDRSLSSIQKLVRLTIELVALVLLPLLASILLFWLPHAFNVTSVDGRVFVPQLAEIVTFAAAQATWSIPSALFYVFAVHLMQGKFSTWGAVRYGLGILVGLMIIAMATGWRSVSSYTGMVAQLFGGVLPMSASSTVGSSLLVNAAQESISADWRTNLSLLRTGVLCGALSVSYVVLQAVIGRRRERS